MIAIVTDSTAGLTRQEAKDLGVVCIPMTYTISGTVYPENFLEENGEFEKLISAGGNDLHTSQASLPFPPAFQALFPMHPSARESLAELEFGWSIRIRLPAGC